MQAHGLPLRQTPAPLAGSIAEGRYEAAVGLTAVGAEVGLIEESVVAVGSIAAWQIVTRLMTLSFAWQAGSAAIVVAAALVVTVGLGLAGTLLALNQKPATVLRNL